MKDGICVKCKAENIRFVDANRTSVSVPFQSLWSSGSFTCFYVCGDCGYLEIYIADKNDLPKLNEDWAQVKVKK